MTRTTLQALLQDGTLRPDDLAELERLPAGRAVLAALREAEPATPDDPTESRLREILDQAPVLVWQADEHGAIYLNQAYSHFVGQPVDQLVAMGWTHWVHPEDAPPYLAAYQAAFERRARFEGQFRLRRHDGQFRWLSTVGRPSFEDGRFRGYIGCSFDVTDLKAAEQALRERQRWFAEIVDVSPGILWVTDESGQCNYLSRRWYELTGQRMDEGLGLGWVNATHPDDQARTGAAFREALETRTHFSYEYRLRLSDGSHRWFLDQGEPRFGADGRFLGHVGHVVDIEERKSAEILKAQATQELQVANQRKDEFLAVLAHELRNPLAPISAGLHIVQRVPGSEPARRATEVMGRQLAHMVRLIDDLMDHSRISRGRVALRKERCDLRVLVERSREGTQVLFDGRGQPLEVSVPDGPVWVEVDAVRLVQVVTNLLTNASRYSPVGTGASLVLDVDPLARQAVLTVSDRGAGIPPDRLETVFEMFSPLNAELGRERDGLGLGLALSRSLVERHGGTLRAESAGLGRGARFTLRLALAGLPAGG